ncbi:MAG: phosphatase PAP2 family protein [Mycobacteriales bacterium]
MHGSGRLVGRIGGLLVLLLALIAGLGLLVTRVLENTFPLSDEDAVDRSLEAARTPAATALSGFFSLVGSTVVIIGVMLLVAIAFRLVFHRWRESVYLVLAVSAQSLVFLLVTLLVSRDRPAVVKLDQSPPTSSFPSGHTGASTALYVGIAVVLAWHTRRTWARRSVIGVLVLVPLSVAVARLYRGMHHPSDVVAAFVNGSACVAISARNLLFGALPDSLARRLDGSRDHAGLSS